MSTPLSMRCTACGREYALTAEYQRQYAGQTTACDCGVDIIIPAEPPPSPVDGRPSTAQPEIIGAWQHQGRVVARKGMKLPRRCFKCNVPIKTQMKSMVLEWTPGQNDGVVSTLGGWARGNLFPVDLIGFVSDAVAATETEAIVIRFGRCPAHESRLNKWWLAGTFGLVAAAILLPLTLQWAHSGWTVGALVGGLILSMVAMIECLKMGPPFRMVYFASNHAWIEGFGKAYVASLPLLDHAGDGDSAATALTGRQTDNGANKEK
jgi:hypothetical protein